MRLVIRFPLFASVQQAPKEQKKIAADIQKEVYDHAIVIPLGQFLLPSAWRKSFTSVLSGPATPVFWNIEKTE
jgi:peptide/nickel transport system substrate-binding protein